MKQTASPLAVERPAWPLARPGEILCWESRGFLGKMGFCGLHGEAPKGIEVGLGLGMVRVIFRNRWGFPGPGGVQGMGGKKRRRPCPYDSPPHPTSPAGGEACIPDSLLRENDTGSGPRRPWILACAGITQEAGMTQKRQVQTSLSSRLPRNTTRRRESHLPEVPSTRRRFLRRNSQTSSLGERILVTC